MPDTGARECSIALLCQSVDLAGQVRIGALREIQFGSMTDNVDLGTEKPMVRRPIQAEPFRLNNERNVGAEGSIVGGLAILNSDSKIRI